MVKASNVVIAAAATAVLSGAALAQGASPGLEAVTLAFNLECLEAEFYSWAARGTGLSPEERGGGPASIGAGEGHNPSEAFEDPKILEIATEIAEDEIAHVEFLRAFVNSVTDVTLACPKIDVSPEVFDMAATAAVNLATGSNLTTLDPQFNPYANQIFFLHGAYIFEDVGVTAYLGALDRILQLGEDLRSTVTTAAAGILGVEAYHAGIIRDRLAIIGDAVTPYELPVTAVVGAISNLRDSVTSDEQDQGIVNEDGTLNLVPTDANGIAIVRTEAEAVAILNLGGDSSPFFPEGFTPAPGSGTPSEEPAAPAGEDEPAAPDDPSDGMDDAAPPADEMTDAATGISTLFAAVLPMAWALF